MFGCLVLMGLTLCLSRSWFIKTNSQQGSWCSRLWAVIAPPVNTLAVSAAVSLGLLRRADRLGGGASAWPVTSLETYSRLTTAQTLPKTKPTNQRLSQACLLRTQVGLILTGVCLLDCVIAPSAVQTEQYNEKERVECIYTDFAC